MKTKLMVVGAAGRMGKRIICMAVESGQFDIVGAVDKADVPDIGKDAGVVSSCGSLGVTVSDVWPEVKADVIIDFSMPQATAATIDYCLKSKTALVLGTTGLNDSQKEQVKSASKQIPLVYATNMSVGMNVLFAMVGKFASMLGEDYDIEIVEQHHRLKKDAPSGTAVTLAEKICSATGRNYSDSVIFGRNGKEALRKKNEIAIHAVRAGDITGIHSIIFGAPGETITLNHSASSRDTFVPGALRAAKWIVGKKPALYSMVDVLGISV
jgi:4-hydroxy-tetrahydrodipicolinate reductase